MIIASGYTWRSTDEITMSRQACRLEVPEEEIVEGYEYAKGSHVLIDPKEIAALQRD